VTVDGFVGWSVAENLMSGTVRVRGNASESAGASSHGGLIIIEGDASSRTGISLKGGTVCVAGDVGHISGFMAQSGVILVGGDAGEALGDSLYEAVIYVAGSIRSLGADAREEDLGEADVALVKDLVTRCGFDHIDPANVRRVASARQLYNFNALKDQKY
jgi:formylmethanofuran dehydrogenase subunit C